MKKVEVTEITDGAYSIYAIQHRNGRRVMAFNLEEAKRVASEWRKKAPKKLRKIGPNYPSKPLKAISLDI